VIKEGKKQSGENKKTWGDNYILYFRIIHSSSSDKTSKKNSGRRTSNRGGSSEESQTLACRSVGNKTLLQINPVSPRYMKRSFHRSTRKNLKMLGIGKKQHLIFIPLLA